MKLLIIVLLFATNSFAQDSQTLLIGGREDLPDESIAKFTVEIKTPYVGMCSAVLIEEDILLTAGHCVHHKFVKLSGSLVAIKDAILHPKYLKRYFISYDIAVLYFEGGLPNGYKTIGWNNSVEVTPGEEIQIVGFGESKFRQSDFGVLRHITTQVLEFDAYDFWYNEFNKIADKNEKDYYMSLLTPEVKTSLETQIDFEAPCDKTTSFGDSGGPALIQVNGHYKVVGLVSGGYRGSDTCLSGFLSSTYVYKDFIEEAIAELRARNQ